MKKLIVLISVFALVLMLTACGGSDGPKGDKNGGGIDLPLVDVPFN